MNFSEYQKLALRTNMTKPDLLKELMQNVLGLADESGEVLAIFKKWIRDHDADPAKLEKDKLKKELGDILWYIAVVSHDLGLNMDDIATANIEKLASRLERNKLTGSGDDR